MTNELPPQGTCRETGPSAVISSDSAEIKAAIHELRCSLSTISGLATANGINAMQEILWTANAGIERLRLILPEEGAAESHDPCRYFAALDCLAGCPRIECQEAGACMATADSYAAYRR